MKIAVTYENGQIFQHFGHTAEFKIYEIDNNEIVKAEVIGTNGNGHEALAGYLDEGSIEILICGGIGGGAINALSSYGIKVVPGASGDADTAVAAYLNGELKEDMTANCNHHGEGHTCGDHGEGHSCGHDCGSHQTAPRTENTGEIFEITKENFDAEVLFQPDLLIVDFWAEWCGPCKMLSPIMEELCKEFTDVRFGKVNTDEQPEIAGEFHIESIPTLAFIKDNTIVEMSVGLRQKEELIALIKEHK